MSSSIFSKEKEKLIQENLLLLKYKVQEQRLEKVWRQFNEAGFSPILIKGWAAALKYPNPAERLYVDVDLIIEPDEFDKVEHFVNESRFDLSIDLHKGARHLDTLSFNQLYANSLIKPCGEAKIRVLSEEDHLRVLAVHWLNDGGAFKDRLWDIYYSVENRQDEFDWDKCLGVVGEKRKFWVICAIGLAHHYFNLKIDSLPFRDEVKKIPQWVFRAIEKEWADEVKLVPLHSCLQDRKRFWQQIKKRFRPNAVQSTIGVNGAFDNKPRIFYQIADMFMRFFPSWKRVKRTLKRRGKL